MSWKQIFSPKDGEHVEFVKRRHAFTFVPQVALFLVMLAIPPVLGAVMEMSVSSIANPLLRAGGVLLIGSYYLGALLLFMGQFVDYYLDISIVTNDRIVDIEQKGLFSRQISELDLSRIQDVNSEVHGIFATLLNYGLVTVQTAGEEANFEFTDVHDPHGVRQRIIELAALDRKREATELREQGGPHAEQISPEKQQGL